MARMTKRRAKALQPKIAMWYMGGKPRFQALFTTSWYGRAVHIADTMEAKPEVHCNTCRCNGFPRLMSLCGNTTARTWRLHVGIDGLPLCKSCTKKLATIAKG